MPLFLIMMRIIIIQIYWLDMSKNMMTMGYLIEAEMIM